MARDCEQCRYAHLMVCEGECEYKGKNILMVFGETNGCFKKRIFSESDYKFLNNVCKERDETREWYDMTGDEDFIYKIGYIKR